MTFLPILIGAWFAWFGAYPVVPMDVHDHSGGPFTFPLALDGFAHFMGVILILWSIW